MTQYLIKDKKIKSIKHQYLPEIVLRTHSNKNYGDWSFKTNALYRLHLGCEILLKSGENGVRGHEKKI